MGSTKAEIPPEKTITLSSLIAPRLARRGGADEPFAWESREYLRKLCIGKEVTFRVDYTVPSIGREFGSVFLGEKNVALLVVLEGWAKVREQGQQKGEASPFLAELQRLEEQAKQQGLGRWNKAAGASEASIRVLPPSAIGDSSNFDAMGLLANNKGRPMEGIVEQVRDGSTIRVYLLPDFQFVQVFIAGIQAPSMGRRSAIETIVETEVISEETNGEVSAEPRPPLTSAQRLAASAATEISPDPFGREAKHFTEIRVLNRDVRIVLEGVDKFSNLIGSVYYAAGDSPNDLALELVENGLAKYVEWSANMMEEEAKRKLKASELQAKKDRLRIWTNYIPPATNSKAIHDQNFTGKVQCGMGRSGYLWAHEAYGVFPDIMTLAKPLAGGLPIGVVLTTERVAAAISFGDHGSTFAGGPLICHAALAVLDKIRRPEFLASVSKKGQYLKELLVHKLGGNPHVKEVRGLGLLVGIELDVSASALVDACRNSGLLILTAGKGNVVRLAPPLVISEQELEQASDILSKCMPSLDGNT